MLSLPQIRSLFHPIQPTVNPATLAVSYQEILPAIGLMEWVYCYWQLQTTEALAEPFHYQVVADGCIDVFFDVKVPTEGFVMGFSTTYTSFLLENTFHYIGIRFLPTVFPILFEIDASILTNRVEALRDVSRKVYEDIMPLIADSSNLENSKAKLDTYFLKITADLSFNLDSRIFKAIHLILSTKGNLNLETDLDTGLSLRQLRRLFDYYVGDSPKTFSKVVRFQQILQSKPSTESLRKNKLFYDLGYYDQAHFIKEFKTMLDLTPTKAFL